MQRWLIPMIMLGLAANVMAADAEQYFESLFGKRLKQVKSTIDRADDLVLANDILTAAQSIADADVLTYMCNQAIDLAQRHPDGLATAIAAARLVAEKVESQRPEMQKKVIELLTRQTLSSDKQIKEKAADELLAELLAQGEKSREAGRYDDAFSEYRQALGVAQRLKPEAAAAIRDELTTIGYRSRAAKKIAQLRAKLLADANDTTSAREIVRTAIVDLNDPRQVLDVVDRASDAKLTRLVPLAAKSVASVDADDALALGEWYAELSASAAEPVKETMWRRTSAYLTAYLKSGAGDQLARTKAEVLLKPIAESLGALDLERLKRDLKRSGPESWISSEATYKTSSGNGFHRNLPDLLTGGKNLHDNQFAFTTAENTAGQYVVIDLGSEKIVSRIWIENRRDNSTERAKGMSVYLSDSSDERGEAVWTAEKVAKEWTIDLPHNMKARYITIKQADSNREPLHLAQVKVFGWEK